MSGQTYPEELEREVKFACGVFRDGYGLSPMRNEFSYYAWTASFGSTCGPWQGIGGQAISRYVVHLFEFNNKGLLFCHGMVKWIDKVYEGGNMIWLGKWPHKAGEVVGKLENEEYVDWKKGERF